MDCADLVEAKDPGSLLTATAARRLNPQRLAFAHKHLKTLVGSGAERPDDVCPSPPVWDAFGKIPWWSRNASPPILPLQTVLLPFCARACYGGFGDLHQNNTIQQCADSGQHNVENERCKGDLDLTSFARIPGAYGALHASPGDALRPID